MCVFVTKENFTHRAYKSESGVYIQKKLNLKNQKTVSKVFFQFMTQA